MLLRRLTICAMLLASLPEFAAAQGIKALAPANPSAADEPVVAERIPLAIVPAAEPRPALRYHLLPPAKDRKPGNAVAFYYRAIHACVDIEQRRDTDTQKGNQNADLYQRMMDARLDQFPMEEARQYIAPYARALAELRIAAYREECDWGWRLQEIEGFDAFRFLLSEIQDARRVSRILALKARLEIAEGKFDDALETMRCGFQLSRDVAKPPILINALVGYAVSGIFDRPLHDLMQQPGSPNLYWAMTEFSVPFIDIRPAVEYEVGFPTRVFPFLKDAESAVRTPEQWTDLLVDAFQQVASMNGQFGNQKQGANKLGSRVAVTALAMKRYPAAKKHLVESGFDAKKVDAMPVGQVIAIDQKLIGEYVADEIRKFSLILGPDARRRMQDAESKLKRDGYLIRGLGGPEVVPILSTLLPASTGAAEAMYRREVTNASLRVIEAIRMHAATAGELPKSLDEITIVPVPANPKSGKPFPYRLDGNKATLEVRRSTEEWRPLDRVDRIYEITITEKTAGAR